MKFDVQAGDFDGDGTDEIVAVGGRDRPCGSSQGCWDVYVRVFDVPDLLTRHLRDEPTTRTDYVRNPGSARRSIRLQLKYFGQPSFTGEVAVHQRFTSVCLLGRAYLHGASDGAAGVVPDA